VTGPEQGREVWRVNAFTDQPFAGNPAGVVPEAAGLETYDMQKIAAEVNDISETVFVLPPERDDSDLRLRYFTSTTEVDLCGHATVAALFTLAWTGRIRGTDEVRTLRAETPVGILQLGLEFADGRLTWATMEQLVPEFGEPTGSTNAAEVLGLTSKQIAPTPPIGCCTTGIWVCYVPLVDLEALAAVRIRPDLIESMWPENAALCGIYAFAFRDIRTTQGRFFSPPQYGILEDPVTGTASGGLAAYLMQHNLLPGDDELLAYQGVEMGRPGQVRVRRNRNGRMAISGQAAPVFRGRLLT
jgi:PhzF family phenazine biosynthesis protein